jgi:2-polyprenyl-6-methoxyphenol hydroxylase-like FAD-dependent oxidoreductase
MMAGLLLARAGVDALVLEKHGDFNRDFRGDTVHPSTMDVLDELGWLDDFLRRPHQEVSRIRAHIADDDITIADFGGAPARRKFVTFMPQWDFLDFLAERAQEFPRFRLRMNATVTDLLRENGTIHGVRARVDDRDVEIRAPLVIAADGRSSLLRARAGLSVRDIGVPIDVLWMCLPKRADDPTQSVGWMQRGRFVVFLDRGEYWQVAFVIHKAGFDALKDAGIEAFRRDLVTTAPFLGDRVEGLRTFEDVRLLVVKIDRLERWYKPGLLCIGDCAHAMSPVGGVGINLAIQDAVAAANMLAEPLRNGRLTDRDLARVQRRREFPTRATQALQLAVQRRIIGRVLGGERPLRVNRALRLLDRTRWLQRIPAYIVGRGIRPEHVRQRTAVP